MNVHFEILGECDMRGIGGYAEAIMAVMETIPVAEAAMISSFWPHEKRKTISYFRKTYSGEDLKAIEQSIQKSLPCRSLAFETLVKDEVVRHLGMPEDFDSWVHGLSRDRRVGISMTREIGDGWVFSVGIGLSNLYSCEGCQTVEEMLDRPERPYQPSLRFSGKEFISSCFKPSSREVISAYFNRYSFDTELPEVAGSSVTMGPYTVKNAEFPDIMGALPLMESLTETAWQLIEDPVATGIYP